MPNQKAKIFFQKVATKIIPKIWWKYESCRMWNPETRVPNDLFLTMTKISLDELEKLQEKDANTKDILAMFNCTVKLERVKNLKNWRLGVFYIKRTIYMQTLQTLMIIKEEKSALNSLIKIHQFLKTPTKYLAAHNFFAVLL